MSKAELTDDQRRELAELRREADSLKIDVHPRMKSETIRALIISKYDQNQRDGELRALQADKLAVVETKTSAQIENELKRAEADRMKSEEEMVSYVQTYLKRGMNIIFNGDNTWTMTYQGKMDSGHMTASKQAMNSAAEKVYNGAKPRGYKNDDNNLVLSA